MINKITRDLAKELNFDFDELLEDFKEDSYREERRGSSFYTCSIVEINQEYYPNLPRELDGFWETEQYIDDSDYGFDKSDIGILSRVEKISETKIIESWKYVE